MTDTCDNCKNTGWVCEHHRNKPWEGEGCCNCGGAGTNCKCNPNGNYSFDYVMESNDPSIKKTELN